MHNIEDGPGLNNLGSYQRLNLRKICKISGISLFQDDVLSFEDVERIDETQANRLIGKKKLKNTLGTLKKIRKTIF